VLLALAAVSAGGGVAEEVPLEPPTKPTQQELMAERGFVRYRGAWRTVQEIELIERAERATLAQKEWNAKLERLRRQAEQPSLADRAAEEIREISDPYAVPALTAALGKERVFRVRGWYVEALSRIRSPDAIATLVAVALDHVDPETRIAAVERLVVIGPHLAVPTLVAALRSADNAQVNRAAEALGRLRVPSAVGPLIDALETVHVVTTGDGTPEGSTSATFTPAGGGLSMGAGPKRRNVAVRNERVLEALVALTGANFEWDATAWHAWFANRQAPPTGFDPRRG
jgi:HEAT repeat protein